MSLELLLQDAHPDLHPLVKRSEGLGSLTKEVTELLRRTGGGLPSSPEELVKLGERALELEEFEEVLRAQWPSRAESQAAKQKLLHCGITSPQALLRALTTPPRKCELNRLLEDAGFPCFRKETVRELAQQLEVRIRERIEVTIEGERALLVTAPHNIYLRRDGQPPHAMEEYTTLVAQRIARQLGGSCISWSRTEQRRSELLWFLARWRDESEQCPDPGLFLDPRNRDPNYLCPEEVLQNPWFRQMSSLADQWHGPWTATPMLHVDVHGCRDPPATPSHLTVGLAAMRHQAESGKGSLTLAQVEAFGAALEAELSGAIAPLDLRPRATLVRVLMPSLSAGRQGVERLSGAWPLEERRFTQSQQAVAFANFQYSCQLELSKVLRKALSRDDAASGRVARAIHQAWVVATGAVPQLPRVPSKGAGRAPTSPAGAKQRQSSRPGQRKSCPARARPQQADSARRRPPLQEAN